MLVYLLKRKKMLLDIHFSFFEFFRSLNNIVFVFSPVYVVVIQMLWDMFIIRNLRLDMKFKKLLVLFVIYYRNIKMPAVALIHVDSYQGGIGIGEKEKVINMSCWIW